MGMCLEGKNQMAIEVRSESIIMHYGPDESEGQHIEMLISEIPDLEFALQEAKNYIAGERAKKHASTEDTKKMLKRDWEGRYIQIRKDVQNRGGGLFEAGGVYKVDRSYNGLHIQVKGQCHNCPSRGWQHIIIPERDVILLSKDYDPTKDTTL